MNDNKKYFQKGSCVGFCISLVLLCSSFYNQNQVFDITGTVWKYYSNGEYSGYTIQFGEHGAINSSHPLDVTQGNDAWRQQGKKVHFWFNDHYSDYKGKIIDHSLIRGKAVNVHKKSWVWELRRETPAEKEEKNKNLVQ